MKRIPGLSFLKLWNIRFGFFGGCHGCCLRNVPPGINMPVLAGVLLLVDAGCVGIICGKCCPQTVFSVVAFIPSTSAETPCTRAFRR